jgi:ribosome-associated heat shock protein Hsp15
MITKGRLRINGAKQRKPGHAIGPGDVLTFPTGQSVRVIRVLGVTDHRGPAPDAQLLYLDLAPSLPATASPLE